MPDSRIKIPFTGFDVFLLALEKQYTQRGAVGNVCRYVIDLEGKVNLDDVQGLLRQNDIATKLFNTTFEKAKLLKIPFWVQKQVSEIEVGEFKNDELIPIDIKTKDLHPSKNCLSIDIVHRSSGNTTIIFSWNHMLMDGYGAVLFLNQLFNSTKANDDLFSLYKAPVYNLNHFFRAAKAKFFIDYSSRIPVSVMSPKKFDISSDETIQVITFDKESREKMDKAALSCGAFYGRSAFYLACVSRAVQAVLEQRKTKINNFWIPVPRDNRKKGAKGPIIGNRLSFLFYRLKKSHLSTLKTSVAEINRQMVSQIKIKMPEAYNHLMNFMKWLPLGLYYHFLKRRGGNSIASFLFTSAADHPNELNTIIGKKVTHAMSLPANANPPGITFAFMNVNEQIHLMIMYYKGVVTENEFAFISSHIQHELTTGNEAS